MPQQTSLLPPVSAVRIVWAHTGTFSKDEQSQIAATLTQAALKNIQDRAEADELERKYVTSAIVTMNATLRSLEIIHKSRELNFEENEKLRSAYLESITENLDFGNKAQDVLKSLPAMTIGGAGGLTLVQFFSQSSPSSSLSDFRLWTIGLACAAAGYLVNLGITRLMRKRKQMLYVKQDYERGVYYDQYVSRAAAILTSLYLDLDRLHKNVFGQSYPVETEVAGIVSQMLQGVRPTFCKYIHKHMHQKKISPELWSICETGQETALCPFWEGGK